MLNDVPILIWMDIILNKYHVEVVLLLPFLTNHDQLSVNYDLLNYCYYVVAPAKLALKRCNRKKELSSSKSRFSYIDILFFLLWFYRRITCRTSGKW